MKTKSDKKVNRVIRNLNKQLREDVFEDRFYVRQCEKFGFIDCREYHGYVYEFIDNKYPERNFKEYFSEGEILISAKVHIKMNDFIINSDFWETFDKEKWFKDKNMCYECHQYRNFRIKYEKITEVVDNKEVTYWGEVMYCKTCGAKMYPLYDSEMRKRNIKRIKEALDEHC